jgi:hypothetical protein
VSYDWWKRDSFAWVDLQHRINNHEWCGMLTLLADTMHRLNHKLVDDDKRIASLLSTF